VPPDVAILSPHLDDAVLSCWSVLTGEQRVLVVNVFTGAPAAGSGARWWDRMTGAGDSTERMHERIAEDRAALAVAGREAANLGLPEVQYREGGAVPALIAPLVQAVGDNSVLYAPAAMGDHADHTLVRDAALALHAGGIAVTLYADLPHAIARGWPSWVPDGAGVAEVDGEWDRALRAAGIDGAAGAARVRALGADSLAGKVEALRAYATQLEALDALAFRPLLHPETLRYEVFWPLG
jgi:LmbE family N-acetylglucosaminyl deacetylase